MYRYPRLEQDTLDESLPESTKTPSSNHDCIEEKKQEIRNDTEVQEGLYSHLIPDDAGIIR